MLFPFHHNTHSSLLLGLVTLRDNSGQYSATVHSVVCLSVCFVCLFTCLRPCLHSICVPLRSVIIGVSFTLRLQSNPVTGSDDDTLNITRK